MGIEYRKKVDVGSLVPGPLEAILYDDFEQGDKWDVSSDGTYEKWIQSQKVLNGSKAIRVVSDGTVTTTIKRKCLSPTTRKIRLIANFSFTKANAGVIRFLMYVGREKETDKDLKFGVDWEGNSGRVHILNEAGIWELLRDDLPILGVDTWTRLDLIIDRITKEYLFLTTVGKANTISGIKTHEVDSIYKGGVGIEAEVMAATAAPTGMLIDSLVLAGIP